MKKIDKKKIISDIIVIILSIIFIFAGQIISPYQSGEESINAITAEVIEIIEVNETEYTFAEDVVSVQVIFKGKLTSGENSGEIHTMEQYIDGMYFPQPKQIANGDNIIVSFVENVDAELEGKYSFVSHNRSNIYLLLIGAFILIVVLIGRGKGLSTLISLGFTIASIFYVFIPSILFGKNVYITTIAVGIFIIFMSLSLINGFNKKTFCAIFGNLGGVALSGILAIVFSRMLNITGITDQDYIFLHYLENGVAIDLIAVVWAGIMIGCLGAVMDVSMSIASAMYELSENMDNKSYSKLVKSGMNIGKDAIGTMTNTLILAYVGGSLAIILLFTAYNRDFIYLINLEMITVEILKSIVGSMGILFALPVTVLLSARVYCGKKSKKVEVVEEVEEIKTTEVENEKE